MSNVLDEFTKAYIECALWASTNDEGAPLDRDFGISNLHFTARARMVEDCEDFQAKYPSLLDLSGLTKEQQGHDFWLTRNRHGAGFWDRGLPVEIGKALTTAAHSYGSCDLYVGDDGQVYTL